LKTRKSKNRYNDELTDEDRVRFLSLLSMLNSKVVLSSRPNKGDDFALKDCNTFSFQVMTRYGVRTEKLLFNYEPNGVYRSTFSCKSFSDRQKFKRRKKRWGDNFEKTTDRRSPRETRKDHGI